MLATINNEEKRVSINSFAIRRKLKNLVSKEDYQEVLKIKNKLTKNDILLCDLPNLDNGEVYDWVSIGDEKYGRLMYCLNTKVFRSQTMGEFYENSTVD